MGQEKVISRGAAPQLASPGVEKKQLLNANYADDMAQLDNNKEGFQEISDQLPM